jgi:hypothetical protein
MNNDLERKEKLYIEASIAYNNGEPVMSDVNLTCLNRS